MDTVSYARRGLPQQYQIKTRLPALDTRYDCTVSPLRPRLREIRSLSSATEFHDVDVDELDFDREVPNKESFESVRDDATTPRSRF
jgi:hypothetical protein